MARARVVLPAPSSPFRPTTSPGFRRAARVAPSCSVAVSSARGKGKAGILRCRLFSTRPPSLALWAIEGAVSLVAVEIALERAGLGHADVLGLVRTELGELGADLLEMQRRDLLVEELRQGVDLLVVLGRVGPEFDLGQRLVRERRRHHEARMA